jgi:putative ATP-grasp target RiPP
MFSLAARLSLEESDTPATDSPRPFILSRLRPYTGKPVLVPVRYELDPDTQAAIGYDAAGAVMSGPGDGRHRHTGTGTATNQTTGSPGDGADPGSSDTKPDQEQDQD